MQEKAERGSGRDAASKKRVRKEAVDSLSSSTTYVQIIDVDNDPECENLSQLNQTAAKTSCGTENMNLENENAALYDNKEVRKTAQAEEKIGARRMHVKIRHGDTTWDALVDTGAAKSLVDASVLKRRIKQNPAVSEVVKLRAANGTELTVLDTLDLYFSFEEQQDHGFYHSFIVVQGLKESVILGVDFLSTLNTVKLDFNTNSLTFPNPAVPNTMSTITFRDQQTHHLSACIFEIDLSLDNSTGTNSWSAMSDEYFVSLIDDKENVEMYVSTIAEMVEQEESVKTNDATEPVRPSDYDDLSFAEKCAVVTGNNKPLINMLCEFQEVFDKPHFNPNSVVAPTRLRQNDDVEIQPFQLKTNLLDINLRKKMKEEIDRLLNSGFISRSRSVYQSPCFFCKQKRADGSFKYRLVFDYRLLNQRLEQAASSPGRGESLFHSIGNASVFSTLDFTSAFHQMVIDARDRHLTGFTTPFGCFQWNCFPFGLKQSPSVLCAKLQAVFQELIPHKLILWVDDMLVFCNTEKDMLQNLRRVFQLCQEHGLKLALEKCKLMRKTVEFVGRQVSQNSLAPLKKHLVAVQDYPKPTSAKQLKGFLGLSQYLNRFVHNFAATATPLFDLLRGKPKRLTWNLKADAAFDKVKRMLCNPLHLGIYEPGEPLIVFSDASGKGIGGVLCQERKDKDGQLYLLPLGFHSRRLADAETRYSAFKLELCGLISTLKSFAHFLRGSKFVCYTDHSALLSLFKTKQPHQLEATVCRWVALLDSMFGTFLIKHIDGKKNLISDALSRKPRIESLLTNVVFEEDRLTEDDTTISADATVDKYSDQPWMSEQDTVFADINAISCSLIPEPKLLADIKEAYKTDAFCKAVLKQLRNNKEPNKFVVRQGFYLDDSGFLYMSGAYGGRLVIPHIRTLKIKIMQQYHEVNAGHLKCSKVIPLIRRDFFWARMRSDINEFVAACQTCQRHGAKRGKQQGYLNPRPIPNKRMQEIHVDWKTNLPVSDGFDTVLVVTCALTRFVILIAAKSTDSAVDTAERLLTNVYYKEAPFETIISDQDTKMTATVMKEICNLLGVKQILTTAYRHNENGLSERNIATMTTILANYSNFCGNDWSKWLPRAQFAMNTTFLDSIQMTPFEALRGFIPRTAPTVFAQKFPGGVGLDENTSTKKGSVEFENFKKQLESATLATKDALVVAKVFAKHHYDKRRSAATVFKVGDKVLMDISCYQQDPFGKGEQRTTRKLRGRRIGPLRILKCLPNDIYQLELPKDFKRRSNKAHISLLSRYIPPVKDRENELHAPAAVDFDEFGSPLFEVQEVLNHKMDKGKVTDVLLKYKGYGDTESVWMKTDNLDECREIVEDYCKRKGLLSPYVPSKPRQKTVSKDHKKSHGKGKPRRGDSMAVGEKDGHSLRTKRHAHNTMGHHSKAAESLIPLSEEDTVVVARSNKRHMEMSTTDNGHTEKSKRSRKKNVRYASDDYVTSVLHDIRVASQW